MTNHRVVKAAGLYFALVFSAGFVLGTVRVLMVVPVVGTRTAELLEMPVMLGMIVLSARWVAVRVRVPLAASSRLGMGGIALVLIVILEFMVVLWIRGLTIGQYWEAFDPVAGGAYFVMLCVFAIMPLLVARVNRV